MLIGSQRSWLRLLQEIDECRDDNSFNLLHADLQNVLSFKGGGSCANGKFLERYVGQEASLHIHCSLLSLLAHQADMQPQVIKVRP
jgi:leucyl aminopeptidase